MKVSLVIPLRDESASVPVLLDSIARQERAPDEVVIVDAGSRDGTGEAVSRARGTLPLRLVRTGELFPGPARNAGAEAARHPWLAFTDGGVRLDPGWLRALAAAAEGADVVLGSFDPVCDTAFRRAAAGAYVPPPGPQGVRGPSVASMLLTRDAFESAGRFPPYRAAEDLIFLERLRSLPLRVAYAPAAVAHWEIAGGAGRTFRRFALYSEHNLRAGRGAYWHRGVLRHYLLITAAAAGLWLAGAGGWSLLVYPLWQGARALRSAWQKRKGFAFRTLDPRYLAGAAALLCLIDLATLVGGLRWLARGRPREA